MILLVLFSQPDTKLGEVYKERLLAFTTNLATASFAGTKSKTRLNGFLPIYMLSFPGDEGFTTPELRKALDVPEPRAGSFLILALKQHKLQAVKVLTGNDEEVVPLRIKPFV